MTAGEWVTAVGAILAGVGGLGWLGKALHSAVFGGEVRRANAAVALTGAAKVMVDELQEEVHAARSEARAARAETAELRKEIAELRRLTSEEISRLRTENLALRMQLGR